MTDWFGPRTMEHLYVCLFNERVYRSRAANGYCYTLVAKLESSADRLLYSYKLFLNCGSKPSIDEAFNILPKAVHSSELLVFRADTSHQKSTLNHHN